ncbi:MAG: HlyC/CorC family transporter [Rhodospirillales bacterium]|nr:HlyC/CorC family transporter [Rhodospirillales bacterium]
MSDPGSDRSPGGEAGPLRRLIRRLRRRDRGVELREAIEEIVEETPSLRDAPAGEPVIGEEERALLANILTLRAKTVSDVMVPRVDIVGVAIDTPLEDTVKLIQREAHSRYPVYRESLDDVIGMVHIKDVLSYWGSGRRFHLRDVLRRVSFVAPTMPVSDMLLDMRRQRVHMALVVDEFGGTDGLLTIEDLVEEIVGEIEDEHDIEQTAGLVARADGAFDATGRTPIGAFEEVAGALLSDEERGEVDTLGGLIFSLAGRIPQRGEVVRHPSGVEFEIVDVDPRRIRRLRVRLPRPATSVPAPNATPDSG